MSAELPLMSGEARGRTDTTPEQLLAEEKLVVLEELPPELWVTGRVEVSPEKTEYPNLSPEEIAGAATTKAAKSMSAMTIRTAARFPFRVWEGEPGMDDDSPCGRERAGWTLTFKL